MAVAEFARNKKPNPTLVAFVVLLHGMAVAAPFFYDPLSVILCVVMTLATLQFGLALGYHRLLSHNSFGTSRFVRGVMATLGTLAAQTGPLSWAATHRYHHSKADTEHDPHSPTIGFSWAHLVWTFFDHPHLKKEGVVERLASDLAKDRYLLFLERNFRSVNVGVFLITVGAATAWRGPEFGVSIACWLFGVRIVALWHLVFMTNSVAHKFGYRNYDVPDDSRNVWWLAILLLGDGWHNNHHAYPRAAKLGHRWFEFDISYVMLRVMKLFGLVWDLVERKSRGSSHAYGAIKGRG